MNRATKPDEKAPSPAKRAKKRTREPVPLPGSASARRQAAVILEVLAGVRRPSEAARLLAVSLPRYYQLERRALVGLLRACEPAPRGPRVDPSKQLVTLERENRRLRRECDRQQALVRMAERSLGLPPPTAAKAPTATAGKSAGTTKDAPPGASTKQRRARRARVRALAMIRSLQEEAPQDAEELSRATGDATVGAPVPCDTCA